MANFNTHLTVATIATAVATTSLYTIDLITLHEMVLLWLMGTFGGILPDIDSDHSTAIKLITHIITVGISLIAVLLLAGHLSLLELWMVVISIVVAVRWIIQPIFASYTRHRGIFHSIVAGLFFWFSITALASLHFDPLFSWTLGLFTFFGFMVHLTLDEIYSVDLVNTKVKRSFGTALKPFSFKYKSVSLLMGALTVGAWFLTPTAEPFLEQYTSFHIVESLSSALLPEETIFGVFVLSEDVAAGGASVLAPHPY